MDGEPLAYPIGGHTPELRTITRAGELEPEPVGCFWLLGAGAARKKIPGAGAAWEKNQEPEPLEKKSGAGAAKKIAGSSALPITMWNNIE